MTQDVPQGTCDFLPTPRGGGKCILRHDTDIPRAVWETRGNFSVPPGGGVPDSHPHLTRWQVPAFSGPWKFISGEKH